jgi:acyl carrier protein
MSAGTPPCLQIVAAAQPSSRSRGASGRDFFEELCCYCNTLKIFAQRHIAERIAWSHANVFDAGGRIMTTGALTSSDPTAIKAAFAANDVRRLVASHFGVSIGRVTDEARFTDDLGADWLDRLELMIAIENRFAGVEITDDDVDRITVVGDLIRHIETMDTEWRRQGAAPVIGTLIEPRLARASKPTKRREGYGQVGLLVLRLGGDAMRSLMGWCPETRQPIDLQLYVDDATLARIWSNPVRFQCPHCGVRHETKVERLASRPLSLEPPRTNRTSDQLARLLARVR